MLISNFINALSSLFQIVKYSFYDKNLYQNIIDKWSGYGIKYFLTLVLVIHLPVLLLLSIFYYDIYQVINNIIKIERGLIRDLEPDQKTIKYAEYAIDLINQLPDSAIVKGELKVNNDLPIVINSKFDPNISIYFDTSVKPNLNNNSLITVTKRNIIIGEVVLSLENELRINRDLDILLSKENILNFLEKFSNLYVSSMISFLMLILAMLIFYFIPKFILSYIIALLIIFNKKLRLDYQQILRLCLITLTPAVVINALLIFLGLLFYSHNLSVYLLAYRDIIVNLLALCYITYALLYYQKRYS